MHELSIAHAVVQTVHEALPGRRVLRVQLRIGVLAGVVPEALGFAWDVATHGTPLAGSTLDVRREPLAGRCLDCQASSDHDRPPPLTCPHCGGRVLPVDVAAGRAMEVDSVEVDDEPEAAGDEPGAVDDEPEAAGDEPEAAGDEPGAVDDEPGAVDDEPSGVAAPFRNRRQG